MDEMKIKIGTKFMRDLLSKLIKNIVRNKIGIDINLSLNELEAELIDGKMHFHVNVDGSIDESVLLKASR